MTRRTIARILMLGLAGAMLTAGCAGQRSCLPEPTTVSPESIKAGSSVTVGSPAAKCGIEYDGNKTYTLGIASDTPGKAEPLEITAKVAPDGSFTTQVPIPADFPAGPAAVLIQGSTFDDCPDNGSCAAYMARFTVTR